MTAQPLGDPFRVPSADESPLPTAVAAALTAAAPDPGAFSFTAQYPSSAHCVVEVAGDIDMKTAPAFRAGLEAELVAGALELILDFTGVTFMGSSGLAVLVECRAAADRLGTKIYLVGADSSVARLLFVRGLNTMFGVDPPRSGRSASRRAW